jgi:glutamyl/glutaminyl-tRNA synthetase
MVSEKIKAYNKAYYQRKKEPKVINKISEPKRQRSIEYKTHNKQYKIIKRAVDKYKKETEIYQPQIVYFKKSDYTIFDAELNKWIEIGLGLHAKEDIKKNVIVQYYIGEKQTIEEFNINKIEQNQRNYAIKLPGNYVLNCFNYYHCQASLVNTVSKLVHKKHGQKPKINARIVVNNNESILKKS